MNEGNNVNNVQNSYSAGQLLMEKKRGHKVIKCGGKKIITQGLIF